MINQTNLEKKRDLSVSMLRGNVVALFIGIPVAIMQLMFFSWLHNGGEIAFTAWGFVLFLVFVGAGILVHELIHGLTWVILGKKPFSVVKFGVQWRTLTPYAHLREPIDVTIYRIGGFMPGLILGILPYILSLVLGSGGLLWFSIIHTVAAGGDWIILWTLRHVKRGTRVEDHPSRAGCYVLEA